jgi:thioredoxin 1
MIQITSDELQAKIGSGETFMVDMFATWCGPCKVLMGNLKKLSDSGEATMPVYTFDVDSDRDLIMNLGVRSVPTLKVYKDGSEVFSEPGVKSTQQLLEIMSKH